MCHARFGRAIRAATSADATPPVRAAPDPAVTGGPVTGSARDTQAEPAPEPSGLQRKNHGSRRSRRGAGRPGSRARHHQTTPACQSVPSTRDTCLARARRKRAAPATRGVPCTWLRHGRTRGMAPRPAVEGRRVGRQCQCHGPDDTGHSALAGGFSSWPMVMAVRSPPVLPAFLVHRQMPDTAAEGRSAGGGTPRASARRPGVSQRVQT